MKKVSLLFGVHMHQPVDNFGEAVQDAIEKCYRPFFETMQHYPAFKFSVHCSGWLLDTIRQKEPKLFAIMQDLTKSGSIEWIGAGYYEPVLSSIPSRDRVAQIKKLSNYIKKHFKAKPKGLWLTERVWEASIVPDISACEIDFAIVDDYHFLSSGYDAHKMDGYYVTEESGIELGLFPIAKSLRYALPFFSVERAIGAILATQKSDSGAAIIFDDVEKFGLWPKTHEWVYEKKWLEGFVEAVLAHEAIETKHYHAYMKQARSKGLAYLTNTSYSEMGDWSLKHEQTVALEKLRSTMDENYFNTLGISFLKGGMWKNFFIKYPESNYLHKRMLHLSLEQESLNKSALESLYKLQTNDVFWHGVFGGLYLPNLRDNAYRYLLEIERTKAKKEITSELYDIDKDGYEELKILTQNYSAVFSSACGAQMMEFGSLQRLFNWQNTLTRRQEAYHEKLHGTTVQAQEVMKEDEIATIHADSHAQNEELKAELLYDWHQKFSFIDHFTACEVGLESFKKLTFAEIGDFANQPFSYEKRSGAFIRDGGIYLERSYATRLKKRYTFEEKAIELSLGLNTEYKDELHYACEMNFHFAHPKKVLFNGRLLEEGLSERGIKELLIEDDFTCQKIKITLSTEVDFFAYIFSTVSRSELGFERVAQGVSFLFSSLLKEKMELKVKMELLDV